MLLVSVTHQSDLLLDSPIFVVDYTPTRSISYFAGTLFNRNILYNLTDYFDSIRRIHLE